ncbi:MULTISPECIES: hypothetical protein [Halolamina]|uniref:Uncharacterized protein n=1 Tax=Halolamina pelagica TaxID=699431 RepID=A0A1I5UX52_9EURY|nr:MULTISPECIES: hypothetical protein [Halolamina]NHX36836.1 hypothetical protein [Halolamina sp. R1-12]SFP99811.1 hypothetical protein SAMN05216277_11515 [Halolamina pelagica]
MDSAGLGLVEGERGNALVAWAVLGFLLATGGVELLTGELVWAGFVLVVVALGALPAVLHRNWQTMLPWELLVLAALPVGGRVFVTGRTVGQIALTGRVTTYVAVAAVALIVAVLLDRFTSTRMNDAFAVVFVVITTMAAAGIWAVAQWLSDIYLGTGFLNRPHAEEALMWDFTAATMAGVLSALLFTYYFRRRANDRTGGPSADGPLTDGGEPQ